MLGRVQTPVDHVGRADLDDAKQLTTELDMKVGPHALARLDRVVQWRPPGRDPSIAVMTAFRAAPLAQTG